MGRTSCLGRNRRESVRRVHPLLDDSLYSGIAAAALEQKAFEFDSDEARDVLEQYDSGLLGEA